MTMYKQNAGNSQYLEVQYKHRHYSKFQKVEIIEVIDNNNNKISYLFADQQQEVDQKACAELTQVT